MKLGTIRTSMDISKTETTCAVILSDVEEDGRTPADLCVAPVPGFADVAALFNLSLIHI